MFKNTRKNMVAVIFTAFYTLMLVLNIDFRLIYLQNFRYLINFFIIDILPLFTPVLCFLFLFSLKNEYKFKKCLFPVAFGIMAIRILLALCGSFSTLGIVPLTLAHTVVLMLSCLIFVSSVFIFIGTLFDFKYISFIKYGAIASAVLNFATLMSDFISVGGFRYLQSVPEGFTSVNLIPLITSLACSLFYMGIFVLFTDKKRED